MTSIVGVGAGRVWSACSTNIRWNLAEIVFLNQMLPFIFYQRGQDPDFCSTTQWGRDLLVNILLARLSIL